MADDSPVPRPDVVWWAATQHVSLAQKAVLFALAVFADEDGMCWPSLSTIARTASSSRSTVKKALAELDDLGLLSREVNKASSARLHKPTLYTLNLGMVATPDGVESVLDVGGPRGGLGRETANPRPRGGLGGPRDGLGVGRESAQGRPRVGPELSSRGGTNTDSSWPRGGLGRDMAYLDENVVEPWRQVAGA